MGRGWGVRAERLQSTGSRRGISRTLGNLLDNEEFLYVHESTHDHSISVLRDGSLSASQVPSCGELKSGGGFPGRRRERPPRPPHWRPTDPSGTPTPPVQLGVLTAPGFCFSHCPSNVQTRRVTRKPKPTDTPLGDAPSISTRNESTSSETWTI